MNGREVYPRYMSGRTPGSIPSRRFPTLTEQWSDNKTPDDRQISTSGPNDEFDFEIEPDRDHLPQYGNPATSVSMEAFVNNDGPWTPFVAIAQPRPQPSPDILKQLQFGSRAPSDRMSTHSGPAESDSGYCTAANLDRNNEQSTVGLEPLDAGRKPLPFPPTSQLQEPKSVSRSKDKVFPCQWAGCPKVLRCRSDLAKHDRWHRKPYTCNVPNCDRQTKGFITQNDLDRHKKSKHFNGLYGKTKSYQCAGESCRNPKKIWPRLDNFKQHVQKMHPHEDLNEVITRSKIDTPAGDEEQDGMTTNTAAGPKSPYVTIKPGTNRLSSPHNSSLDLSRPPHIPASKPPQRKLSSTLTRAPSSPTDLQSPLGTLSSAAVLRINEQDRNGQGRSPNAQAEATSTAQPSSAPVPQIALQIGISTILSTLVSMATSQQVPVVSSAISGPGQPPPTSETAQPRESLLNALESAMAMLKQEPATPPEPTSLLEPESVEEASLAPVKAEGGQTCEECGKVLKRACDMNKHRKRHTKPYGCTFDSCNKVFGSKNDWKRHENSLHFADAIFKCDHPSATGRFNKCHKVEYHEAEFLTHLATAHSMSAADAQARAPECKQGRNGQTRFWCGFCGTIVALEHYGVGAYGERYDHIDKHFIKEGRRIDDWVDPITDRTKREMREEKERRKLGGESGGSRKRGVEDEDGPEGAAAKRPRRTEGIVFFCCHCGQFNLAATTPSCTSCNHEHCNACEEEEVR